MPAARRPASTTTDSALPGGAVRARIAPPGPGIRGARPLAADVARGIRTLPRTARREARVPVGDAR
jgi:hypothetical protein